MSDKGVWRLILFRNIAENELNLRQLFDASPNAYVIFDRSLNIVGCNATYLSAVGRATAEEIVGRNLFEAFPSPEDSASYKLLIHSLQAVLREGRRDHLAIIPYDTSLPDQPANMRYWSATHTPIFAKDGELKYILQHTVDITELQKLRERDARSSIAEAGVLHRAVQVQAANEALNSESQFVKELFQQAPGFIAILAGPAHTFIVANDAYMQLIGGRDPVGMTVADVLPEVVEQGFVDILDEVYRTGEPYVGKETTLRLYQPDSGESDELYLDFIYQPLRSDDGSVNGIFVQGQDVTDRVEARHLERVRYRELGHRLKNQLSVVQAVVNQTLRAAESLGDAQDAIANRLNAMAGAHEVLITNRVGRTTVAEIVDLTKSVFDHDTVKRFEVSGPEIRVGSRPALSLALLLHELATNAVKHGSLSTEQGSVSLRWNTTDDGLFAMEWCEEGGPEVKPPQRRGAGMKLIRAGLSGTVHSKVSLDLEPTGLCCRVEADLLSFGAETPGTDRGKG